MKASHHVKAQSLPSETEPTTDSAVAPTDTTILDSVVTTEAEPTEDITTDLVKENPFRYAGYYFDRKTQNYYLQARYYDPRPARFISEDTYEGEIENPLSLNLYTYAHSNPLIYTDPSGHSICGTACDWVAELFNNAVSGVKDEAINTGEYVLTGGYEVAKFLVINDIDTILDPDAPTFDKVLAATGFIPVGKIIKGSQLIIKLVNKEGKVIQRAVTATKYTIDAAKNIGAAKIAITQGIKSISNSGILSTNAIEHIFKGTKRSGWHCVSVDGDWTKGGACQSTSSIYLGPDSLYAGRVIINAGTIIGTLKSSGETAYYSVREKGDYWARYGLGNGFKGTWYANPQTVIQVLQLMKVDIQNNGNIHTRDTNSAYIQAIEAASFVAVDGIYDSGQVINGIENVQAKYDLTKTENGVVNKATVDALIKNVKSNPPWLQKLNSIGYKMDIGELFYESVVYTALAIPRNPQVTTAEGTGNTSTLRSQGKPYEIHTTVTGRYLGLE